MKIINIYLLLFSTSLLAEGYKVNCSIRLPFVAKARIKGEIFNHDGGNKWISNIKVKLSKNGFSKWNNLGIIKQVGTYFLDLGTDTYNFFPIINGKKTLIVLRKNGYMYSSVFYDNVHYPSECDFEDL